ncbi:MULTISPECIES: hypothetical protein [Micromonospora]|uniref:DAGKc domain-containing protein n=1 Tax=Micromonospora sp. HUAS YX12 TaxID=3156396 RepID=A0AAU7R903_9ACTN
MKKGAELIFVCGGDGMVQRCADALRLSAPRTRWDPRCPRRPAPRAARRGRPPRVFRRWATTATVPTRAAATRSAPTAVLVLVAAGVTQPIRSLHVGCPSPRRRRL